MITLNMTLKYLQRTTVTLACSYSSCSSLWCAENGKYSDLMPKWSEQIQVLDAIEPKLAQKDHALFNKVSPLLNDQPTQAIALIRASDQETHSPIFDFWLGHLLLAQDQKESAEAALKHCLTKFPNFRKAHRTLANLFAQKGDIKQARHHALKVIELGGANGSAYGLLAYTHFESGNFQSALSSYRMAIMFKPDHLSYRKGELYSLAELQQHEAVISLCEELLELEPNQKQYWMLQVNAHLQLSRPLEAITLLEILQNKGLAQKAELEMLGQLYFNQELFAEAVNQFDAAMRAGASFKTFIQPLNVLISQSHHKIAQQLLTATQRYFPRETLASQERWLLAEVQLLLISGSEDEAEKRCRQLLDRWPTSESGLMTLASHLNKKGNKDEARFFYERAAQFEKVQLQAWRELGRLAWQDGDAKSAVLWLEKVDELQPSMAMKQTISRLRDRL